MEGFGPNVENMPPQPPTQEPKKPVSPELLTLEQREAILQALPPNDSNYLAREFTDEQIEKAKLSEGNFYDVLNTA